MLGKKLESSFRDPSGFMFIQDDTIYRQINISYKDNYVHLKNSGLYAALVDKKLLIQHEEIESESIFPENAYKIIRPKRIPFISYPYEWSFSQLKDVALTTLAIQKEAHTFGMSLKDANAYNIQFIDGNPIFIDTLSFEKYISGSPWIAYRQFCQHFLAPLALMSYSDIRLNQLSKIYIDGIPLDLASTLLPARTRFNFSLLSHIHLHAKSQKHYSNTAIKTSNRKMSQASFLGIIDSLETAVKRLNLKRQTTEWANYYDNTNYSSDAFSQKKEIVSQFLDELAPKSVWDIGSNQGVFSRIASDKGIYTISFDIDPIAVEKNYLLCRENKEISILPLLLDLTNPSPGIGWDNQERSSIINRGPTDTVLALALIHHLAISNNLPFDKIAEYFSNICKSLIVEFIPKNDSKVQILLSTREDIFTSYKQSIFESEFKKFFNIIKTIKVKNSERIMYLMVKR